MISKLYAQFLEKNPSPKEQVSLGKSIRKEINRSSIGQYIVEAKRHKPIEILKWQAKTSWALSPQTVWQRYLHILYLQLKLTF